MVQFAFRTEIKTTIFFSLFCLKHCFNYGCPFIFCIKLCKLKKTKHNHPLDNYLSHLFTAVIHTCNWNLKSYQHWTISSLNYESSSLWDKDERIELKDSTIFNHLNTCANFQHLLALCNFLCCLNTKSHCIDIKEFYLDTVRDNTSIIDRDSNWNLPLFKETYHIKKKAAPNYLWPKLKGNHELLICK